jgi:DNA-directed RNA polymerase subunit beta
MSKTQSPYQEIKYSNLAKRRNYAKLDLNFKEPDLLELQKNSYNKFIESEIESVVETFFPVKHAKNNKYEVQYHGINFAKPIRNEEQARNEGRSYERALYVDLSLVNNETGEVKRVRKTKTNMSEGVFFANIPIMTEKGTFIINGIEKFVISQIVRSPGAYVLSKSQIKLNSKKKVNEGYIVEVLPSRGTLMNFWIDRHSKTVKVTMRNSIGDAAPTFPATQLLKAFGMSQDEIRRIFKDDLYVLNTLYSEPYNHQNIMEDFEITGIRKTVSDMNEEKNIGRGSPIDTKLKQSVLKYVHEKKTADELRVKYEELFANIATEHEQLVELHSKSSGAKKNELSEQIKKLTKDVEKVLNKLTEQESIIRGLVDCIITEKAAKDLISLLSISTRSIEAYAFSIKAPFFYQDVLVRHFMDQKQYDLTGAGRYKLQRKLRMSERLYQRIIVDDIVLQSGKVLIPKGTLILKDELDQIKKAIAKKELKYVDTVQLVNEVEIEKKQNKQIESINVYVDNDVCDITTNIIGPHEDIKDNTLTLVDFISIISYTVGLPHDIGTYDDIDHLGNKRLRLIHEQLKNKLQVGMSRVEKHIKEKLASISIATANDEQKQKVAAQTTVKSVVNTKAFQLVVKNFFNSYQLTQFIDQQNPLSELTNKRRISAMGDGGISREDPNLDIRDVHYSHFGRICPIETPEGMNIGLIMSLAAFTQVDANGFLTTPYHRVIKGVIQDGVE